MKKGILEALFAAFVAVLSTPALAGEYYVTPTGAGSKTGASWNQAFDSIQSAINLSTSAGDNIYLRYGVWSNTTQLVVSNLPGLIMRGGYAGSGSPGPLTNVDTVITRYDASPMRLMYVQASTVTVERISVKGGYLMGVWGGSHIYGCGCYLLNSATTIKDCNILSNYGDTTADRYFYGGGVFVSGGQLTISGTTLSNNCLLSGGYWGSLNNPYGGAIYATAAAVTVSNCLFVRNYVTGNGSHSDLSSFGGAAYFSGGSANVIGCTFTNNWSDGNGGAWGGAVYATGVNPLLVSNCVFRRNYIATSPRQGGSMYLGGSSLSATITECEFMTNGTSSVNSGDTCVGGGTVHITSVLFAANCGNGVVVTGGTVYAANATMADNSLWGVTNNGGTLTVRSSIAWGNAAGGTTGAAAVGFTDSQDGVLSGDGNINKDPLFVDAAGGDYHEQSKGGSWHGGEWTLDRKTSPCIDNGDPEDTRWHAEPYPAGRRINMGAYGGTARASLTFLGTTILILR